MAFPSPADDHADKPLNLHDYLVVRPASTFFWRYVGDSMDGAGIQHGALLVIDRSLQARSGDIVVANHEGEWVIRRLIKRLPRFQLVTDPISEEVDIIEMGEDTLIWGVVAHAINTLRAGTTRSDRYPDLSDGQG